MSRRPASLHEDDTTTHDSLLVSAGTALARATGVLRVIVIGAVLGPTTFGNAFQVTNSLPNLIYYGFLAGSLVSSLLVPALVRHLSARDPARVAAVANGFLGIVLAAGVVALPLMVLGLPWLLQLASWGSSSSTAGGHVGLVMALAAFTAPQVLLYALAGTGASVLYAHRRFALPACAPALENVGMILVFLVCAAAYGVGRDVGGAVDAHLSVPTGEVILLGLGSTTAVALHAGLQWWGARRCGVVLRPRRGWADPEVRAVASRAVRSMAQAGLLAAQTLALLVVMARIPGGVVALQIALNFYFLPLALIATPVGLAVLPRLVQLHQDGDGAGFWDAYARALRLGLFLVVPAAAGYAVLADPIAEVVGVGAMATSDGQGLVSSALAMLALGLTGAAVFFIATQACYAREDARSPLRSMMVQAGASLTLIGAAVAIADDGSLMSLVSVAYSLGCLAGAAHLFGSLRARQPAGAPSFLPSLVRVLIGTVAMLPAVVTADAVISGWVGGRPGAVLVVVAGTAAGALVFAGSQALLKAPELAWLRSGLRTPAVREEARLG